MTMRDRQPRIQTPAVVDQGTDSCQDLAALDIAGGEAGPAALILQLMNTVPAASAVAVVHPAKPITRVVRTARPSDCPAALPPLAPGERPLKSSRDRRAKDVPACSGCNHAPPAPVAHRAASPSRPYPVPRARSATPRR